MTNFKNMWSNGKRYFLLLNNVLIVLLRIHLAPDRERSRREYIDKKKVEKMTHLQTITLKIIGQVLQRDLTMDAEDCLKMKDASCESMNRK
jgi:hypothetical protein